MRSVRGRTARVDGDGRNGVEPGGREDRRKASAWRRTCRSRRSRHRVRGREASPSPAPIAVSPEAGGDGRLQPARCRRALSPASTKAPRTPQARLLPQWLPCSEVEIDPATGVVSLLVSVVDDVGTVINPGCSPARSMAVAQGVGQIPMSRSSTSRAPLLTASFMDYAMPRRLYVQHEDRQQPVSLLATNPREGRGRGRMRRRAARGDDRHHECAGRLRGFVSSTCRPPANGCECHPIRGRTGTEPRHVQCERGRLPRGLRDGRRVAWVRAFRRRHDAHPATRAMVDEYVVGTIGTSTRSCEPCHATSADGMRSSVGYLVAAQRRRSCAWTVLPATTFLSAGNITHGRPPMVISSRSASRTQSPRGARRSRWPTPRRVAPRSQAPPAPDLRHAGAATIA